MCSTPPCAPETFSANSKNAANALRTSHPSYCATPWRANSQSEDFWQLLLAASKADSALERAVAAGEPAHVAKYAFQLAQAFNNFYHQYSVIHEENREKKVFLLWMTDFFRANSSARPRS